MSYLQLGNFKYGLDTRRGELTSLPGTLEQAVDCHINQGGEIEKRKAFVLFAQLPSGQFEQAFGLEAGLNTLYTFVQTNPGVIVTGLTSIELNSPFIAPDPMTAVILSTNFAGTPWAVAQYALPGNEFAYVVFYGTNFVLEFTQGVILITGDTTQAIATRLFNLINGGTIYGQTVEPIIPGFTAVNLVSDGAGGWQFDFYGNGFFPSSVVSSFVSAAGVLTVTPTIISTAAVVGMSAVGSFQITGGSVAGGGALTSVKVNGQEIMGLTIAWVAGDVDGSLTAAAVMAAINNFASNPHYTATATGNLIAIAADTTAGSGANGFAVKTSAVGDFCVDIAAFKLVGSVNGDVVASVQVGTLPVLLSTVTRGPIDTDNTFAAAVAANIASTSGTTGYTAFAHTNTVRVSALVVDSNVALPIPDNIGINWTGTVVISTSTDTGGLSPTVLTVGNLPDTISYIQPLSALLPWQAGTTVLVTTPSVTVLVKGGTPPYTFEWIDQHIGDNPTNMAPDAPTGQTTTFSGIITSLGQLKADPVGFTQDLSHWACKVTDSASNTVTVGGMKVVFTAQVVFT